MSPAGDPSARQRLLDLADQVANAPDPSPSGRRSAVLGVAAVIAVLVFGIGAAVALSGGNDDRAAAGTETPTATTPDDATDAGATTTQVPATTAPATTAAAPTTTEAPAATEAPATTEVPASTAETLAPATTAAAAGDVVTTDPASGPVRWAEFSGGKVYLEGVVPDQATADEIRDKAAAVVGPDNVVVMYEIVPGAPRPPSAPLYVRDSVLFAKNSVEIDAAARGVLDLGVVLMNQNPQITIDISGHTDSDGTAEMNQSLSERRVQVILDYLVAQGIDPARLTTAAFGETQPIADNATAAGRAANRRVEFRINDLLG